MYVVIKIIINWNKIVLIRVWIINCKDVCVIINLLKEDGIIKCYD